MIGVVVAAHGELAQALVATARLVVPNPGHVVAVGIEAQDDTASYEARLQAAVASVQSERGGVLVLTDMFGGTPSNVGLTMHQAGRVEVLTGANLPMLIKALQLSHKDLDLATAARQVKESGARAIAVASEVLAGNLKITEKSA
jgi:PTS system mannose-specific IIA component